MEVTTWNWQWSGVFPHSKGEEETCNNIDELCSVSLIESKTMIM